MPESAKRRTFQTSRRGLALPRQRPKGRRRRRDFGTGSTRRRDAARWRDEKRNVFGQTKSQTVEAARAQSRQGRTFEVHAEVKQRLRTMPSCSRQGFRQSGRGTAGWQGTGPRDHTPAPDGTGAGASAGRQRRRTPARSFGTSLGAVLKAPGVKCPLRDPHAGESGVGRKAGPISLLAPEPPWEVEVGAAPAADGGAPRPSAAGAAGPSTTLRVVPLPRAGEDLLRIGSGDSATCLSSSDEPFSGSDDPRNDSDN